MVGISPLVREALSNPSWPAIRARLRLLVILFGFGLWLTARVPLAEEQLPAAAVNFAYATVLGTGVYEVGERRVYVLNMPFHCTLREPSGDRPGLRFKLPVSLGTHQFDWRDILEDDFPERLQTVGFVPGLELVWALTERWRLKPFAQLGYVADLQEDNDAYVYVAGIKSLYQQSHGRSTLSLGAGGTLAGQRALRGGSDTGFGLVELGVDWRHPLGLRLLERNLDASLFYIASRYFNDVDFLDIGDQRFSIRHTHEIGVTLGIDRPVAVCGVEFDRVGVGYQFGDGLDALRFNLGFPF
jgi:hypothetical protein